MGGSVSELGFLSKVSFDRLSLDAWEPEALSRLVISLGGVIVEILPPSDSCNIAVKAWLQDPNGVPKLYDIEIPGSYVRQSSVPSSESDYCASPSPPGSPTSRRSIKHQVIIHVEEVLDHSHVIIGNPALDVDDKASTKRRHRFHTWFGRVDGTGPPPFRDGAHSFGGPVGRGRADGANV